MGEVLHVLLLARADLLARVVKVSSEVRADKNYWLVGCKYVRGVEPKDAESRVCRIVPRTTGATRCHGVARLEKSIKICCEMRLIKKIAIEYGIPGTSWQSCQAGECNCRSWWAATLMTCQSIALELDTKSLRHMVARQANQMLKIRGHRTGSGRMPKPSEGALARYHSLS